MKRKYGWKAATVLVATLLMFSLHPEVRLIGLLAQAIGLDVLVLFIGAQIAMVTGAVYHRRIQPMVLWLNSNFKKIDSFYFVPTWEQIRKYPPIATHSVPLLVPLCFLVLGNVFLYA